jgi:23S rRNA (adenine1618-N6)-methyltransferase
MSQKEEPIVKSKLHPLNKHRGQYNFKELIESYPELKLFVQLNKYNVESIDFAYPEAVKALNKALLMHFYNIQFWDIPKNYLCPPIPGRADYIHNIAELLGSLNNEEIPTSKHIKCLDTGVGANCIYPLIGNHEYQWSFVGSDIDPIAIKSAKQIVDSNADIKNSIELRLQKKVNNIFKDIIKEDEKFDVTICNPPFHSSLEEANAGTTRKLKNLNPKPAPKPSKPVLNFGGTGNELWCIGGEGKFINDMILESKLYSSSCLWFTTLVSKESNLKNIYKKLKIVQATTVKTLHMGQGNKKSRIVVWTFHTEEQQKEWVNKRWL